MNPARMAQVLRAAAERIADERSFFCCPAIGTVLWLMHHEIYSKRLIQEQAATLDFFLDLFDRPKRIDGNVLGHYVWSPNPNHQSQLERSLALLLAAELVESEL